MDKFPITDRTKLYRAPKRGHYDKATVHAILDSEFVCHVAFIHQNKPVVIPTLYGRKDDHIYIHGASVSRMMVNLEQGIDVSISVVGVDGLVLARSAFHHSMNYRSVVLFGKATLIAEKTEKVEALKVISDHILPHRWEEVRLPNEKELKATKVLAIPIQEASAKIRTGDPVDNKSDYALDIWAGILPFQQVVAPPIPDKLLKKDIEVSDSVRKYAK